MHNDPQFIAAMNQGTETYMKEANVRTAGIASRALDSMSDAVDHHNLSAAKFMISRMDKLARGSMSPRVIAKRIRRRDQRVQDYLDAPDVPASKPVITSTVHKLPPAQIPDAAAPVGDPPPHSSSPLNSPDSPPAAERSPGDELPPTQIPEAAAPAGGPPPDSSSPLNRPDSPPAPETPASGDSKS